MVMPMKCGVAAIAHEALHVVKTIMDDVGADFEEEVWAYHLQEIVEVAAIFVHNRRKYGKGKNIRRVHSRTA
jgi:hypothetical protein